MPNKYELTEAQMAKQIEVFERRGEPGVWSVEAIDYDSDGRIDQAIFVGPEAELQARQYAAWKYAAAERAATRSDTDAN